MIASDSRINSSDVNIPGSGIELIAIDPSVKLEDYNTTQDPPVMQPIPKGTNLENALEEVTVLFEKLCGVFAEYVRLQGNLNNYFACHTHLETFYGNQGIPSIDIQSPLYQNNMEVLDSIVGGIQKFQMSHLSSFKTKYINKLGPKYINSKFHYLN